MNPIKPKKCKVCKIEFTPTKPLQQVCGFKCALELAKDKRIKTVKKEVKEAEVVKPEGKFFYGRGGRKTATANVRLYLKGKGEIIINGVDYKIYFPTKDLQDVVLKPLKETGSGLTIVKNTIKLSNSLSGGCLSKHTTA